MNEEKEAIATKDASSVAPIETETVRQPDGEDAITLHIKPDKEFQTIRGFGAAYTWYSERMLEPSIREEIADLLFKDAKMTILRFKNEYLYNDKDIEDECRETQIYKMAQERADQYGEKVTVLMSCWSPPARLKSNDAVNGGGTLKKDKKGRYIYEKYGDWWAKSVEAYKKAGLPIDYVSIQNESDFTVDYDGMELASFETEEEAAYSQAYLSTYNALQDKFGTEAPLMLGPETMSCDFATIKVYMGDIMKTKPESINGIAFHLYLGGDSSDYDGGSVNDPKSFNQNFRDNYDEFGNDYELWQTEFYRGSPLQTAMLMNNSLTYGNLSSYIYWTGVWEGDKARHDIMNIDSEGNYHYGSTYWVMRHFSEFIRPGYRRVQVDFPINQDIGASAFKNSDATKLAVVLVNPTDADIEVLLPIEGYGVQECVAYQTVLEDDAYDKGEYYNNLGKLDNNGKLTLKSRSITTVDITGNLKND